MRPVGAALFLLALTRLVAAGDSDAELGCGTGEDYGSYWIHWFAQDSEEIFAERFAATGRPGRAPLPAEVLEGTVFPLLGTYASSATAREREAAVLAIGKAGTARAVRLLLPRLSDPDPTVKRGAVLALGLTGEAAALGPLLDRLRDPLHAAEVALALGLLGRREALPALLEAWRGLASASPWAPPAPPRALTAEAFCLALALGALGGPEVAGDLAVPLHRLDDPRRTPALCQALGRIGGPRALGDLLAVRDLCRDRGMRAAAAGALGHFRGEPRAVEFLLGLGGLRSGDRRTKLRAILALARVAEGLDARDPVRRLLEREFRDISEHAVRDRYESMYGPLGLAFLGADAAIPFLRASLSAEGRGRLPEMNRRAIAVSLALLGSREPIPDLRRIVAGEESWEYRGCAALALGILGDAESRETIRAAMSKPAERPPFLEPAARSLGLLGDRRDTDLLLELLARDGPVLSRARAAAARAVGMIGDPAAVGPLAGLLGATPDTRTATFALAALGALADRDRFSRLSRFFAGLNWWGEPEIVQGILGIQ